MITPVNQKKGAESIDYDVFVLYYDVMKREKIEIYSYGIVNCGKDWSWDTGKFPQENYDLWIVMQGEGILKTADQDYPVMEGSCFLLRPMERYLGEQNPDNRMTVFYLHFNVTGETGEKKNLAEEFRLYRELYEFDFLCQILYRITDACGTGRMEEAAHWLRAVLDEIRHQDSQNRGTKIQRKMRKEIQELCRNILHEPGKNYRLKEVAGRYGYSPDYFGRIFSRIVGKPLSEYVISVRMNQAKFMLRESDQGLWQIAEALGYQDAGFFCRQFKNRQGCTPGHYRKMYRKTLTGSAADVKMGAEEKS